jgi:hypothetical protein
MGGSLNTSYFMNEGALIPGVRLNPLLVDKDNLKQDDKNKLWKEYIES